VSKGRWHGNQFSGLKLLLTGFVWTIMTRQLVMKGVWVVVNRMQILPILCT